MFRHAFTAAVVISSLAGLSVPSIASAQVQAAPQRAQPAIPRLSVDPFYNFPVTPPNTPRDLRLESQLNAERQKRLAIAFSPTRVRLANQVGALIDRGDCAGAAHLAWYEHDSAIAAAVPAVCAAHRTHPTG